MQDDKPNPKVLNAGEISPHLGSEPIRRMEGWRPRTKARVHGRPGEGWIQDSYPAAPEGKEEEYFRKQLIGDLGNRPPMASIKSIMEAKIQDIKSEGPNYKILLQGDALQIANFPTFKDGVMIIASQGDCQERLDRKEVMVGQEKVEDTLRGYTNDPTQGARFAMSTVDATAARRVFVKDCDMMLAWLDQYDKRRECFDYQNGYLTPKENKVGACITLLEAHGTEILMNIQQARVDNSGPEDAHHITQVPCFAFALGSYDIVAQRMDDDGRMVSGRSEEDQRLMPGLCQLLLTLQYQAVAQLAVLKSQQLDRRVSLVVPPVGAGVFCNPREEVAKAIASMAPIVGSANVDVVVSIYDSKELDMWRSLIPFLKNATTINHEKINKYVSSKTGNRRMESKRGEVSGDAPSPPLVPEPQGQAINFFAAVKGNLLRAPTKKSGTVYRVAHATMVINAAVLSYVIAAGALSALALACTDLATGSDYLKQTEKFITDLDTQTMAIAIGIAAFLLAASVIGLLVSAKEYQKEVHSSPPEQPAVAAVH